MLQDAARNEFDIILAWRKDRLYRGMRAMLLVMETIQEHKIAIMLARETFDPKIAPLRAWVAQMEILPPAVLDRPHVECIRIANNIRGWK